MDRQELQLLWGDLHNHNEVGYGQGAMERSYEIARGALDVYAFTPHTWWPDLPEGDQQMARKHRDGFQLVADRWDDVVAAAARYYEPGRFVTILGWEWHSLAWGDYAVLLPGSEGRFERAETVGDLHRYARQTNAILLPHHGGYRQGWRGLNWQTFDPRYSPVVEIHSEHGSWFEADDVHSMYSHSMGGVDAGQVASRHLGKGTRFGVVADTDDHHGYPGSYGYGVTGIYARERTRESVLEALRARHTYACTGDRVQLWLQAGDTMMGDSLPIGRKVQLRTVLEAPCRPRLLQIYKNGRPWRSADLTPSGTPALAGPSNRRHWTRLEWGWDGLGSHSVTTWDIEITLAGGRLVEAQPGFCGGAGSTILTNQLLSQSETKLRISSYTSRRNARPVSSVALLWEGDADSSIRVDYHGHRDAKEFSDSFTRRQQDLLGQDHQEAAWDALSAPKLKLHAVVPVAECCALLEATDPDPTPGDNYLTRVMLANGEVAWSSPIWYGAAGTS